MLIYSCSPKWEIQFAYTVPEKTEIVAFSWPPPQQYKSLNNTTKMVLSFHVPLYLK